MKRSLLIFTLLWGIYTFAIAENTRYYKSGQLTCNLITAVCQDAQGYIWVSTEYGLNKFDGVQFSQYLNHENDSTSLLNNSVHSMMVDNEQRLWIGVGSGLQYYVPETDAFHTVPFPDDLIPSIRQIVQLSSGKIWLVASVQGIFELDCKTMSIRALDQINKLCGTLRVNRICEDQSQRIWISTDGEGLVCIDSSLKHIKTYRVPELPSLSVSYIQRDGDGDMFFAVKGTLMMWNEKTKSLVMLDNEGAWFDIRNMTLGKDGKVYVATFSSGLYYIDKKNLKLLPVDRIYTPYFSVNAAKLVSVLEDRNQNLWLGCFQKGLLMVPTRPTSFNFWDFTGKEYNIAGEKMIHNDNKGIVTSVYRDKQGFIWGGLEGEGLFKFNDKGEIVDHITTAGPVVSMLEDSENNFWIGTYSNGLGILDPQTGKQRFLPLQAGKRIKSIVEDSRKNIYVAVLGEGLHRFDARTQQEYELCRKHPETKGLQTNLYVNSLVCDSEDRIWMGHYVGISCYDSRNDRFIEIEGSSILNTCICYSLLEARNGNIWIGTNNGLYVWEKKSGRFNRYTTEKGLSNNMICGLAEDKEGNIWCSTFKGINQLKIKEDRFVNYYTGNGLTDKEYSRGVYYTDKNGTIYFGGSYGITSFSPEKLAVQDFHQEVMLTNMYIGNVSVNTNSLSGGNHVIDCVLANAKDFYLSHEDNTFTFEFSTMDYREPENIYYEYRLLGLSPEWSTTLLGVNRITYNHLSPGNYIFEVRACENGFYTPVKKVQVHIAPPWYRTWIAYCCYTLLMLALILQFYLMMRRKRQEEINEAKLKFFINIAHEIRSPMTMIISPLESLLKRDSDENTMKALRTMYKNANRIIGLINQLLDIRKIDKGQMTIACSETDMVGFINDIFQTFEYQAEKRNIRFSFDPAVEELPVWIDRNNFDKVLVNLLSNAFKYTQDNGEIEVRLSTGVNQKESGPLHHFVEIVILDSGPGIDESKLEKIFERFYQASVDMASVPLGFGIGLNLCRLLVDLHHGIIVAANRKDKKGSCFTIRIPLGKAHLRKDEIAEKVMGYSVPESTSYVVVEKDNKNQSRPKTSYKVLVVDDDEDVRNFLTAELKESYRVIACKNGEEALQAALTQLPDLVISDIKMPEMDGYTLLKKLKSNSNTNHIPVILLTSNADSSDRIQGLDKGADAYMTKPFIMEELQILIGNLIENRLRLKGKFSGAQGQEERIKPLEMKSNDEMLMERVMKVVNDNLTNTEFNVEMMAEEVGLSRVQLHRKLKELTGIPTGEFIRNIRLKQAEMLLREKKINVSQVAFAVGFSSQTHFSVVFKRAYGMSPTEFVASIAE